MPNSRLESSLFGNVLLDEFLKLFLGDGDLVFLPVDAVGEGGILHFLVAEDDGVGDFLDLGVANLVAKLFVGIVDFDADVQIPQFLFDLLSVFQVAGEIHRQQFDLNRGEPSRESSAVVLNQNADETLNGAEDDAVEHHRLASTLKLAAQKCEELFNRIRW